MPGISESYGVEKHVLKRSLENYKDKWHYLSDRFSDQGMLKNKNPEDLQNQQIVEKWNMILKLRNDGLNNKRNLL